MPLPVLDCSHYTAGRCRSCTWLERPYDEQLAAKQASTEAAVRAVLGDRPQPDWLPPVPSAPEGFRTKAKMVVGGTVDQPTLGLWSPARGFVDIRDCALHSAGIRAALPVLAEFIGQDRAGAVRRAGAQRRAQARARHRVSGR